MNTWVQMCSRHWSLDQSYNILAEKGVGQKEREKGQS